MNPTAAIPAPLQEAIAHPMPISWVAYFQGSYTATQPQGGTTAQRPASPALWQIYFDTTIGLPIWCNQITPTVTWQDAAGNAV